MLTLVVVMMMLQCSCQDGLLLVLTNIAGQLARLDSGGGVVHLNLPALDQGAVELELSLVGLLARGERHKAKSFRASFVEDNLHVENVSEPGE